MGDRYEIFRRLNVKPAGLLMKNIQIKRWGEECIVDLLYYIDEETWRSLSA